MTKDFICGYFTGYFTEVMEAFADILSQKITRYSCFQPFNNKFNGNTIEIRDIVSQRMLSPEPQALDLFFLKTRPKDPFSWSHPFA